MMTIGFRTILSSGAGLMVAVACFSFAAPENAHAQRYASKQRSNVAVGHYSRARTMMVEALKEFEQGRRLARPDLLVDSEDFRLRLISLTEQLNRVIDPKPRVTRQGAIFRANPRLIRRQSDQLPAVPGAAQDSNIYGEAQRLKELENARARMYENVPAPAVPVAVAPAPVPVAPAVAATETVEEQSPEEEIVVQVQDTSGTQSEPEAVEDIATEEAVEHATQAVIAAETGELDEDEEAIEEDEGYSETGKAISKDEEIANAIELAIQERLKSLETDTAEEEEIDDEGDLINR